MREILRNQLEAMRERPAERLLKPGIKAAVIVALLSAAAHFASERSYDRSGLAKLAAGGPAAKAPATTARRP
jgi:hypothetical protein